MDIKGIEDGSNSDLMMSIVDLLKRGDEEIKCCMKKELVLIIGTTGTGKSTLAQFLVGNTERLRSKPNSGGTSFTIVDEDDTISHASTILSKTIFPSIVEDRISNTLYCDCPGFSDTRSAAHDIAANYFINRIVDSASSVKFLFAIHQGAVEEGYEREPFILMVKHATNFIKNLEKYKNSIALVVTKVNSYNMHGRIGDGDIVAGIAGFLRSALKDLEKEKNRPDFQIERGINFIKILLEDECQKIGLFRKPVKPGRLCDFEETLQERNLLQKIILNIIRSVEPQKGDFGYTLSADSQNHVSDLVNTINREVSRDLTEVGHEIECYYSQKEDFDLEMWRAKFESLYKIFSHIQSEALKNRDTESRHYLKLLIDHIKSNDTKISEIHFENIYNKYRQLDFLNTVSERGHRVDPSCVAKGIAHVKEFFEHSSEWYSFLCRLYSILTGYTVQKNSSFNKIEQKFVLEEENVSLSEIDLDSNLNNILNYEDLAYDNIKDIILNKPKIKLLEHILNITLKDNVDIQYLTSDILILTGRYLKLSEIKCILQNNKAKCIFIMAFYKVFIDADLDETGNETQLVIIAPTWKIIGEPRITLDGRSGEAHDPPQAAEEGESGLAGLPGGPAGIFVAIGGKFVNGQHLRLSAVGGRGGPGQVGGIGASGRDGEDPDVPGWEDIDDQKQKWREKGYNVHVVKRHIIPIIRILERELVDVTGTGGTCGGTGGDGGRGGFGGPAGQVIIINTGGSRPEFLIDCRGGEEGEVGAGGPGGSGGRNGHRQRVYIHRFDVTSGHRFFERQDSPTDMGRAGDGSAGGAGLSARGLEGPPEAVVACGLGQALEVYVRLLGGRVGEGVEVCRLKGFLEQLGNNHQVLTRNQEVRALFHHRWQTVC